MSRVAPYLRSCRSRPGFPEAALAIIALALLGGPAQALVPGHIAHGYGYASGSGPRTQFAASIRVDVDPGIKTYFWATAFWLGTDASHVGYFGLLGNGLIGGSHVGKMAIFSIWGATGAQAAPGSTAEPFVELGQGWSIRRSLAWRAGVDYQFQLVKQGTRKWRTSIHASTGEDFELGLVELPNDFVLYESFDTFSEYFTDLPSCDALPFAVVSYSHVAYDNVESSFAETEPSGDCANLADAFLVGSGNEVHRINTRGFIFSDGFEPMGN